MIPDLIMVFIYVLFISIGMLVLLSLLGSVMRKKVKQQTLPAEQKPEPKTTVLTPKTKIIKKKYLPRKLTRYCNRIFKNHNA